LPRRRRGGEPPAPVRSVARGPVRRTLVAKKKAKKAAKKPAKKAAKKKKK
jgi:hypothetical protein